MKLKPYPKYKPSGIEWLGDVPQDWNIRRLKYIATANDSVLPESTPPDWEMRYVDIGSVDYVNGITKKEDMVFENAPSRARRRVQDGDTIVSTVRTYLRAIAPIKKPEDNLVVSTGFAVICPRDVDAGFLANYIRSSVFVETVVSRSVGVSYPATNASDVMTIPVLLPGDEEQTAIADFLDRETTQIDRLVAKKRELIGKLKEQRVALISRAVTRGLDPNVAIKPSGLDWLGAIPQHWEVKKLRYICKITTGDKDTVDAVDEGEFPFFVRSQTVERIDSYSFDCEAVLTAGDGVGVGKVFHHHKGKFAVHQRVYVLHNFRKYSGRYLFMFMKEFFARVALGGEAKSTVDSLRRPIFTDFVVLFPPLPEQRAIADFLDRETSKNDRLVAKVQEAIARLQE